MNANLNFVRQQGFENATPKTCELQFPALMWQPRVVLVLVLFGLLLETGWYYIGLSAMLLWSTLLPRWSPFDAIYNHLIARRRGTLLLTPAPGPRRTAQLLAGTLSLLAGLAALAGRPALAWAFQGVLIVAATLLVLGRFCFGSYVFYLITGRAAFAHRHMPWSRSRQADR